MDSLDSVRNLLASIAKDNDGHPNINAVNVGARTLVFFHTAITKEGLKR